MAIKTRTLDKTLKLQVAPLTANMGICVTCNNAPDCINLKASSQPVWFCEQFDDYTPPENSKTMPRPAVTLPVAAIATNGGLHGLCATCANKGDCVNLTPGIAKLYCEEYC